MLWLARNSSCGYPDPLTHMMQRTVPNLFIITKHLIFNLNSRAIYMGRRQLSQVKRSILSAVPSTAERLVSIQNWNHAPKIIRWIPEKSDLTSPQTRSQCPAALRFDSMRFLLWGYLKSLVYVDRPRTIAHLKNKIRDAIANIPIDMLRRVDTNFKNRLHQCMRNSRIAFSNKTKSSKQ